MMQKKLASTTVNEYIEWLEQNLPNDTSLYRMAHGYLEGERQNFQDSAPLSGKTPFLSIITRTQGKRPEMLEETLLSLTGQSNTDFELLITGHNMTEEQSAVVAGIISEQPDWMRERIRLIPVVGGTRSTPLNVGFEEAKGSYIAVLDDDDLVFDHWVETFYQMSQKHFGKILHTYSVIQSWETVGGDFPNTPRAAKAPENTYCCDFDFLNQLRLNKCPFCALAFPAFAYKELGLRFDETLTTTEDWDFLMRTAFITGVADSSEITFLYRNWLNAENSSSLHAQEEWLKNSHYVVKRFSKTPFIMPVGSLKKLYDEFLESDEIYNEDMDTTELFYDDGEGFLPEKLMRRKNSPDNRMFPFVYDTRNGDAIKMKGVRFDPRLKGLFSMKKLLIRVVDENDNHTDFTIKDVSTNGYVLGEKILFLKTDPQIILHFPKSVAVKELLIGCEMKEGLTDAELDAVLSSKAHSGLSGTKKRSALYRGARKIYHISKRVLLKK
ncbi:MAG: glycosyltransferase [Clostridia bacterium]|nr:glycosyltransferase [Clostridia bacterium]